jgi:TRAP transporter TAXI family solute receptor
VARAARKPLKAKNIRLTATATEGQWASTRLMNQGEFDLAILQNVLALDAVNGSPPLFDKPMSDLRALFALADQYLHLAAVKGSGIKSAADLKGRKVGVGVRQSSTWLNSLHILKAHGLKLDDLAQTVFVRDSEAANQLRYGKLEAAFFTAPAGLPALFNAAAKAELIFIPLAGPGVEKLLRERPGYRPGAIPAGTYDGLDKDLATVSVRALLMARTSLEEEVVASLMEAVFSSLAELAQFHPGLAALSLEKAVKGLSLPLHPGAEKYLRAKGVKY